MVNSEAPLESWKSHLDVLRLRSFGSCGKYLDMISESIGEQASPPSPPIGSEGRSDSKDGDEPPPRFIPTRRRLSVKEKVAALDRNSNEQPEPLKRTNTIPRDTSARVTGQLRDSGFIAPATSHMTRSHDKSHMVWSCDPQLHCISSQSQRLGRAFHA